MQRAIGRVMVLAPVALAMACGSGAESGLDEADQVFPFEVTKWFRVQGDRARLDIYERADTGVFEGVVTHETLQAECPLEEPARSYSFTFFMDERLMVPVTYELANAPYSPLVLPARIDFTNGCLKTRMSEGGFSRLRNGLFSAVYGDDFGEQPLRLEEVPIEEQFLSR